MDLIPSQVTQAHANAANTSSSSANKNDDNNDSTRNNNPKSDPNTSRNQTTRKKRNQKRNSNRNRNHNHSESRGQEGTIMQGLGYSADTTTTASARSTTATITSSSSAPKQPPPNNNNNNTRESDNIPSRSKRRNRKPKGNQSAGSSVAATPTTTTAVAEAAATEQAKVLSNDNATFAKSNKARKNNRNRTAKKKRAAQTKRMHAWWRVQTPSDAVDPITLDPLNTLEYPPFALAGMEPYEPVEWPIVSKEGADQVSSDTNVPPKSDHDRERRVLQEQWGGALTGDGDQESTTEATTKPSATQEGTAAPPASSSAPAPQPPTSINLFDGRALAYYMVSQLQFIDPLNRRDLSRDELVHLDRYLRRHSFFDLNCTEAYDAKGVTLSSAGAAAQTVTGRAAILQQEASVLLNALFGNTTTGGSMMESSPHLGGSAQHDFTTGNPLMQQYQEHVSAQQQSQYHPRQHPSRHNNNNNRRVSANDDIGIYGSDAAGLVIIDDDVNPGLRGNGSQQHDLRGNAPSFVPSSSLSSNTLYSASHIANRYRGYTARARDNDFPSLSATAPSGVPGTVTQPEANPTPAPKKTLPKAKTLKKIGNLVQKTSEAELQRQWDAREQARRKAALSNLAFGAKPPTFDEATPGIPSQITTTVETTGPSEAMLERNKAFAMALGVRPSTARTTPVAALVSGWMRPSEATLELDEYGNELNTTVYPNSLILQAREISLGVLLKLEKKWRVFLSDDSSASLPLNRMDRSLRKMVHEYAGYWKLHTESFDPEPKRYIHCVKLRDTSCPYPLLSQVLHKPLPPPPPILSSTQAAADHPSQQTAGQITRSGLTMPTEDRVPLSLKPRSTDAVLSAAPKSVSIGVPFGGAPSRSMVESDDAINSRVSGLVDERQRPKLDLMKRTLPLELPPIQAAAATATFDYTEEQKRQKERSIQKSRKERDILERKQQALEAAFASDDEKESSNVNNNKDDSDSEWGEQQEPAYMGDDDEW